MEEEEKDCRDACKQANMGFKQFAGSAYLGDGGVGGCGGLRAAVLMCGRGIGDAKARALTWGSGSGAARVEAARVVPRAAAAQVSPLERIHTLSNGPAARALRARGAERDLYLRRLYHAPFGVNREKNNQLREAVFA